MPHFLYLQNFACEGVAAGVLRSSRKVRRRPAPASWRRNVCPARCRAEPDAVLGCLCF
ncbi:hypothetical protein HRbin30_01274 [bacterium HR30]|nr:hypothetical protein HRbin30_01274 [bacterium HR30]